MESKILRHRRKQIMEERRNKLRNRENISASPNQMDASSTFCSSKTSCLMNFDTSPMAIATQGSSSNGFQSSDHVVNFNHPYGHSTQNISRNIQKDNFSPNIHLSAISYQIWPSSQFPITSPYILSSNTFITPQCLPYTPQNEKSLSSQTNQQRKKRRRPLQELRSSPSTGVLSTAASVNNSLDNYSPSRFNIQPITLDFNNETFYPQAVHHDITVDVDDNISNQEANQPTHTRKFFEPWNFGKPSHTCQKCGAIMWFEERLEKHRNSTRPTFGLCCLDGKVKLPLLQKAPEFLDNLLDLNGGRRAIKFQEKIRIYNGMFAFTSMGGVIDNQFNNGRDPYIFRLNGQNHHKIGSLLPISCQQPKFA